jgi:carbamoyl-phosphate synthase large subunit
MVDTSAAEFPAETPYFYSSYAATGSPPEAPPVAPPAAVVIGSGPVRIGQGIEFDYCAVQAADALRRLGWQAVMINSTLKRSRPTSTLRRASTSSHSTLRACSRS